MCPPRSTRFPYTTLFRSEERRFARAKAATTCPAWDGTAAITAGRTSLTFTPGTCAAATAIPPAAFGSLAAAAAAGGIAVARSEEHTSELQSHSDLVCRLL